MIVIILRQILRIFFTFLVIDPENIEFYKIHVKFINEIFPTQGKANKKKKILVITNILRKILGSWYNKRQRMKLKGR